MRETDTHIYFWGSCYSNFWLAPTTIDIQGEKHTFISSEHAFMALKAVTFGDYEALQKIKDAPEARYAKAEGRKVKGLNGGRWDDKDIELWSNVCYEHMLNCCYAKFSQNANLKYEILDTGNKIIVEASPEDEIWGVGLHESDDTILDEKNWRGKNLLGKVLMEVRDKIREDQLKETGL